MGTVVPATWHCREGETRSTCKTDGICKSLTPHQELNVPSASKPPFKLTANSTQTPQLWPVSVLFQLAVNVYTVVFSSTILENISLLYPFHISPHHISADILNVLGSAQQTTGKSTLVLSEGQGGKLKPWNPSRHCEHLPSLLLSSWLWDRHCRRQEQRQVLGRQKGQRVGQLPVC